MSIYRVRKYTVRTPMKRLFLVLIITASTTGADAQWVKISSAQVEQSGRPQTLIYKSGILWCANLDTLWMTSNDGATWNVRMPSFDSLTQTLEDVEFWDADTGLLSTTKCVYRTTDQGRTWDTILRQNNAVWSVKFIANPNEIAAAIDRVVDCVISRDGGKTWSRTHFSGYMQITDLRTKPTGEVSVLLLAPGITGTRIATTTDYGATWKFSSGIDYDCFSFAYDPCDSNLIYAINEEIFLPSDRVAMFYHSQERGATWNRSIPTNDMMYYAGSIAVSPGSVIFLQTLKDGILRSTDNGYNWENIGGPIGVPDTRLVAAVTDNLIYAAERNGSIWKTVNAGGAPASNPYRNKILASPRALFEKQRVSLCDSTIIDTLVYGVLPCTGFRILNVSLYGPYSRDYSILKNTGDTLIVSFKPKVSGVRQAAVNFTLDNGSVHSVPLLGEGYVPKHSVTASSSSLFEGDTLTECEYVERSVVITTDACVYPKLNTQTIIGYPNEYTLVRGLPPVLTSSDTVTIRFAPKAQSLRSAVYQFRLDDGRLQSIQLRGVGIDTGSVLSVTPSSLFENTQTALCTERRQSAVVRSVSCSKRRVVRETITGSSSSDYRIVTGAPAILSGTDTVVIAYQPSVVGRSPALYTAVMDDSSRISLILDGVGVDTGYIVHLEPQTLFTDERVDLCRTAERSFVVSSSGCKIPRVEKQEIIGMNRSDYVMMRQTPDTLTGLDTVTILFMPSSLGVRAAQYRLMLSDSAVYTVDLGGIGVNPPYAVIASPEEVFAGDTVYQCEYRDRTIRLTKYGCASIRRSSETITGTAAGDYTIMSSIPDSLSDEQYVTIRFMPTDAGLRTAEYMCTFDDGSSIVIPLTGTGIDVIHLTLHTQPMIVCDTILGGTALVPLEIRGFHQPEAVRIRVSFDRNVEYIAATGRAGTLIDSRTGASSPLLLSIPPSEFENGRMLVYFTFAVYADTEAASRVLFDAVDILTRQNECQYVSDSSIESMVIGPAGCGIKTISDFLRYGKVPSFRLVPNPAESVVHLVSDTDIADAVIRIVSAAGALVFSSAQPLTSEQPALIRIDGLAEGMYWCTINSPFFTTTLPLIIRR